MNNMVIDNKNLISGYQPSPSSFYEVQGKVIENKGKDIKIEKNIDDKIIQYSLRLKEEVDARAGDLVKIQKENIVACKTEEKEEKVQSQEGQKSMMNVLKELGLEYTEENIRMIENLMGSGITVTKDSVDSYIKSKECLSGIIENIDPNSLVKLMERGIDPEDENLQNLSQALEAIKNEKQTFSLRGFLKLEKEMTYKDAELIGKEIYGQKMGKDVYDTIIALNDEKIPITRENIEKTRQVMVKLYDLKNLQDETYIEVIAKDEVFNIDKLFKLKNSYTRGNIESNLKSEDFQGFTIAQESSPQALKEVLLSLNIEDSQENMVILREFIINNMDMDKESYDRFIVMKNDVADLRQLLDHNSVSKLINKGIDPVEEDIHDLVESLKKEVVVDQVLDDDQAESIMETLGSLGKIQDKDLLKLLKQGQDFNLKAIKEVLNSNLEKEMTIEYKSLDSISHISKIFNSLGENLSPGLVGLSASKYGEISLENLYKSQEQVRENQVITSQIDRDQENFIFEEYAKARNNLTTNMVRESIKDGRILQDMPLQSLNKYMENKINRYREMDRISKDVASIKGNEDRILPMIIKNDLPMTLKEIKDINEFFRGQMGLSQSLKSIIDSTNRKYGSQFKESIEILQEKLSSSLRDGDIKVKDDYKDLMNLLENGDQGFKENKGGKQQGKEAQDYFSLQKKISKKDIILQFPIESGDGYKDLNIIIPHRDKNIDKNNMNFSVTLQTENLGSVTMDLRVLGRQVYINLQEEGQGLKSNLGLLEEKLHGLGYKLNIEVEDEAL